MEDTGRLPGTCGRWGRRKRYQKDGGKDRKEFGPEETAPRGNSSSSTSTSKNVERLETLETELETINLTEDNYEKILEILNVTDQYMTVTM